MSLQTAPLGQLPSMNMPYQIPTYDKGPSLWEKALGAFLVNAAGAAASQGTENLMSRDYATAEDGGPATGFSRLLGPKVGAQANQQRLSQRFTAGESEKGRQFQAGQSDLAREAEQMQHEVDARNAMLGRDQAAQYGLDERDLADRNAQIRLDRELAGNQTNTRLQASLKGTDPESIAQIGLYKSQGQHYDAQSAFQNRLLRMLEEQNAQGKRPASDSSAKNWIQKALGTGGTGEPTVSQYAQAIPGSPMSLMNMVKGLMGGEGGSAPSTQSIAATSEAVPLAPVSDDPFAPVPVESTPATPNPLMSMMDRLGGGMRDYVANANNTAVSALRDRKQVRIAEIEALMQSRQQMSAQQWNQLSQERQSLLNEYSGSR